MKIAISTDRDNVSAHFGRCPSFTIANLDNNTVINKELLENPGHQPGFIPQFLDEKGIECIIAGGMGMRAVELFNEFQIEVIIGISGRVDDVIEKFIKGELKSGKSLCKPGLGKGYGLDKTECDHPHEDNSENKES